MRTSVTVVIVGTALLGGCSGSGDEIGVATPAPPRWDPCSISAEAIEATGLDPTYRQIGWGEGITVPDWSLCIFRGPDAKPSYFLNVKSSDIHTIEDARENQSNLAAVELQVGGRNAYQFNTAKSRSITDCNVAVSAASGVVVFTVNSMGTDAIAGDPCDIVISHTADLVLLLPPVEK
ncbi:DUF3558 family protein [Rhodococcoides yunnanense]|uniref:DUF3558 family protein n=1 Tax=Rhodococcoides yunnanense TaxID=278209 RepID=UPI001475788B|nr:DUF3558 family protein [Rhodococcus yunnanensis]